MNCLLKKSLPVWNVVRNSNKVYTASMISRCYCSPPKQTPKRDPNAPIPFVGSSAHSWTSKRGRSGTADHKDIPWFQTYVVCGSVAIFLIYFCYLREENDVDLKLEKSLFDHVPGLESTQLIINYKYNRENNLDNAQIIARMREVGINPDDIKV